MSSLDLTQNFHNKHPNLKYHRWWTLSSAPLRSKWFKLCLEKLETFTFGEQVNIGEAIRNQNSLRCNFWAAPQYSLLMIVFAVYLSCLLKICPIFPDVHTKLFIANITKRNKQTQKKVLSFNQTAKLVLLATATIRRAVEFVIIWSCIENIINIGKFQLHIGTQV